MRLLVFYIVIFFSIFDPASLIAETLAVKSQKLNLRSGPGENYSIKCSYSKGFPLKVVEKKGKWVRVTDFENEDGWALRRLLAAVPHAIIAVNRGEKKKVNIRSGPGTKFSVVGQAYYGVVFTVLEKNGKWLKVRHESGMFGWIQRNLLWGT